MNRPKQICIVNHTMPPLHSGAGMAAIRVSKCLKDRGCDVFNVTMVHQSKRLPTIQLLSGVLTYRIPVNIDRYPYNDLEGAYKAFHFLYHMRNEFDIVHCFNSNGGFEASAAIIGQMLNKKTVFEVSLIGGDDPFTLLKSKLGKLKLYVIKNTDAVVVKTYGAQRLVTSFNYERNKVFYIPYGVNVQKFSPISSDSEKLLIRGKLQMPLHGYIITNVGRIFPRKNQKTIVKAFMLLKQYMPDIPVHLFLIGPYDNDGEYFRAINLKIKNYGLGNCVKFTGQVSDIAEYLRASDIFVMASLTEGLPNALLEAMACGLPCVIFDIPFVTDSVLSHGYDGFVVRHHNVDQLAATITHILRNKSLMHRLKHNALHKIHTQFRDDIVTDKYLTLYDEIMKK